MNVGSWKLSRLRVSHSDIDKGDMGFLRVVGWGTGIACDPFLTFKLISVVLNTP